MNCIVVTSLRMKKTCKEVGPFKIKQKLMEENNDLKVYRNVIKNYY